MNPTSSKKKRSCTEEVVPTKRRLEEEEVREKGANTFTSDSDAEDPSFAERWDDIGDEEEMYLAGTREELYELIMKEEIFRYKIEGKNMEALMRLMRSLLTYSQENIEELQLAQPEEEKVRPDERSNIGRLTALVSFQHRIGCMVEAAFRRYREKKVELANKTRIAKELKKENAQLRKSLEEITMGRDEFLGKLDSRKMDAKDASVSMETEVPDVEMADNLTLSSLQGIPQNMVGALEAMIERKMGDFLSGGGLSLEREREDSVPSPPLNEGKSIWPNGSGNGTAPTSKGTKPWSEVVKRSKGEPSLQRD